MHRLESFVFPNINFIQVCLCKINRFFDVFRQMIPQIEKSSYTFYPLVFRNIRIGGVENVGGSCVISVLLQQIAAYPDYFDQFLQHPLKQRSEESETVFHSRVQLQRHLLDLVMQLRNGFLIDKLKIHRLVLLLNKQGCEIKTSTVINMMLHRWFPNLFSSSFTDPYQLFTHLLKLFSEVPMIRNQIVVCDRSSTTPQIEFFTQLFKTCSLAESCLFHVYENYTSNVEREKEFKIFNCRFTLKMVHVCEENFLGKHVVAYRREGEKWIRCNDLKISIFDEKTLPIKGIYAYIYEMRSFGVSNVGPNLA